MYVYAYVCLCVLGLQWIVVLVFGYLLSLMNKILDICLLLEKCCHNPFLVEYKILAHHFAVTEVYKYL